MTGLPSQPNWLDSFPAASPLPQQKKLAGHGKLASFGQTASRTGLLACPSRSRPSRSPFLSQPSSRNWLRFRSISQPACPTPRKPTSYQRIGFVRSNRQWESLLACPPRSRPCRSPLLLPAVLQELASFRQTRDRAGQVHVRLPFDSPRRPVPRWRRCQMVLAEPEKCRISRR
jgi:hypothetical protein